MREIYIEGEINRQYLKCGFDQSSYMVETDLVAGDDGDALDDDVVALALLGQDDGGREEAGDEGETHLALREALDFYVGIVIAWLSLPRDYYFSSNYFV